jgi:hypothetical protein
LSQGAAAQDEARYRQQRARAIFHFSPDPFRRSLSSAAGYGVILASFMPAAPFASGAVPAG